MGLLLLERAQRPDELSKRVVLCVRVSTAQAEEWYALGGAEWLRKALDKAVKKRA